MSVNMSVMHLFDGMFDSGRILYMSREQQEVQSFTDGNVRHKLDLSNWRVNERVNAQLK